MNSADLLQRIVKVLKSAPETAKDISSTDIVSCVFVELYGLRQLYSTARYNELEERLYTYENELQEAVERADTVSIVAIINELIKILQIFPDFNISQNFIEEANYNKAYIRHRKENTVVVIGDSHTNFFSGNEDLSFVPMGNETDTCMQINGLSITVLHLGACLAYKSGSYGSTSRFREKLDWLLEDFVLPDAKIICSLGEIDLRAHVFKQAQIQGKDYKTIIDDVLEHYIDFLTELKSRGYDMYVWGPIASQNDDVPPTLDYPRVGSVKERNEATRYFNDRLNMLCAKNDIGFMSLFYEMINEDMTTREEYLSSDRFHLGQYGYEKLVEMMGGLGLIKS